MGINNVVDESVVSTFRRRSLTCVNAEGGGAGLDVCGEYVRKFGRRHLLVGLIRALTCADTKEVGMQ